MKRLKHIPDETADPRPQLTKEEKRAREYRRYGGIYVPTDGISPWKRSTYILEKHVGKGFDKAFSLWCKQTPKWQQHFFLEQIDPSEDTKGRRWTYNWYYVDSNGIIRKRKNIFPWRKSDRKVTFKSDDYKTEPRHKVTGLPKKSLSHSEIRAMFPKEKDKSYYELLKLYDQQFEEVCVEGWIKTFKNAKDPEYQRLQAERLRKLELDRRRQKKAQSEKAYRFTHETEEQRAARITANFFKILKHGFDPKTSFHKDPE